MSHRILRSLRPQLACLLLIAAALMLPQHAAAASDPVSFTVSYHRVSPIEIDVTFTGRIETPPAAPPRPLSILTRPRTS